MVICMNLSSGIVDLFRVYNIVSKTAQSKDGGNFNSDTQEDSGARRGRAPLQKLIWALQGGARGSDLRLC